MILPAEAGRLTFRGDQGKEAVGKEFLAIDEKVGWVGGWMDEWTESLDQSLL